MDELVDEAGLEGALSDPFRSLRWVGEQISLYIEHSTDGIGLPKAYYYAAQIVVANGDLARGRIFAERAFRGNIVLAGDDDIWTLQYERMMQDPAKHEIHQHARFSIMKWKLSVDDVPAGFGPKEFEDWLWMREKASPLGWTTNLRDRRMFPSYLGLPQHGVLDPKFHLPAVGPPYQAKRNWMFLAEIVPSREVVHIRLKLKDMDGHSIHFVPSIEHFEGRSTTVIREGFTVAIANLRRPKPSFADEAILFQQGLGELKVHIAFSPPNSPS